jgi:hypothetical protein
MKATAVERIAIAEWQCAVDRERGLPGLFQAAPAGDHKKPSAIPARIAKAGGETCIGEPSRTGLLMVAYHK